MKVHPIRVVKIHAKSLEAGDEFTFNGVKMFFVGYSAGGDIIAMFKKPLAVISDSDENGNNDINAAAVNIFKTYANQSRNKDNTEINLCLPVFYQARYYAEHIKRHLPGKRIYLNVVPEEHGDYWVMDESGNFLKENWDNHKENNATTQVGIYPLAAIDREAFCYITPYSYEQESVAWAE